MDVARARALVLRYGWNGTAYQILNPGIEHWFSAEADAVVGYVRRHGVRVVAGAPSCAAERLAAVAEEFERAAARSGDRVCYFGAGARLEALYRDRRSHSMVLLGAQPCWRPGAWPALLAGHASLRAQLNRARNKGVAVVEWPPEQAADHPALHRCLEEWLATRGLPSLHFLVEPETLGLVVDRRILVAEREGRPVGFLAASPVPARRGWLIEQIIRGREAPNGTAELLLDAAIRGMAEQGYAYVTLGLAPLSEHAPSLAIPDPLWLRWTLSWLRAHGRRFYNFEGLDAFKAKFRPEAWEPIFAISNEPRFSARTLYAIAAAFSDGSPVLLAGRALRRTLGCAKGRSRPPRTTASRAGCRAGAKLAIFLHFPLPRVGAPDRS